MVFVSDYLDDTGNRLTMLGKRAADANVTVHTITTVAPAMLDVSQRKRIESQESANTGDGALSMLSDLTGGWFLKRASNGSIVLPRIAESLSQQYVLTFALERADRDGKSHRIDVTVNRAGADIRARSSFVR